MKDHQTPTQRWNDLRMRLVPQWVIDRQLREIVHAGLEDDRG